MVTKTTRDAHDELLRQMPGGSRHDAASCGICATAPESAQEDNVSDIKTMRTFTEAEHEAILTEAVRREVALATEALETENAALKNRVDLIEAEKAEALTAKENALDEFEQFKAAIETAAEVEGRKADRIERVKEIAAAGLRDDYFSDERVTRWAEMADDQFGALLDDMAEQAMAHLDDREVAEVAALEGESRRSKLIELMAAKKSSKGDSTTTTITETAAFGGGVTPVAPGAQGSTFRQYMTSRRAS